MNQPQTNQNKQTAVDAIWQDPRKLFAGEWKRRGDAWECTNPNVRMIQTNTGNNITVYYNHGTGRGGEKTDVFSYVQETQQTGDFFATLQRIFEVYGFDLNLTDGQRKRVATQRIAQIIAPVLVESLKQHPDGVAGRYLAGRGFQPDGVHFGEWTKETKSAAVEELKQFDVAFDEKDFVALGLTNDRAANGYNLVLPYYTDGVCVGFVFRDCTGNGTPKYLYSQGLGRPGYCDKIDTTTGGCFLVEGQFDALRVKSILQEHYTGANPNVIATGGADIGDELGETLRRKGISRVYYIPDYDLNDEGKRRTDLIFKAIKSIQQQVTADDRCLFVIDLPAPNAGNKSDADSFGKENRAALVELIEQQQERAWFVWELENRPAGVSIVKTFHDIYNRATPYERGKIRNYIDGQQVYADAGITPQTCSDIDKLADVGTRQQIVADAVEKLNANPTAEQLAEIARRLTTAADGGTRKEFAEQLAITTDDILADWRKLSEPVQTRWKLGDVTKNEKTKEKTGKVFGRVELEPATISIFSAATSHGKTTILLQLAADYVRNVGDNNPDGKKVLYISFEENRRQLYARAFKTFVNVDKPTTDQSYINFGVHNRNSAINGYLRGKRPFDYENEKEWDEMRERLDFENLYFSKNVTNKLLLVSLETTDADQVTNEITNTVRRFAEQGEPVGLVCVDYAQLLTSDAKTYDRTNEMKNICKALKRCAHGLEIPFALAAQLNRSAVEKGIDEITVSNLGESTEIERIADNVYLVWQVSKTGQNLYVDKKTKLNNVESENPTPRSSETQSFGFRSRRISLKDDAGRFLQFKNGYMYIEQMKARNGVTGIWGLFPYDGERGFVGEIDEKAMSAEKFNEMPNE